MGRGNANAESVALASRSGSLRCVIESERDLLSLQEALSLRPEQYLDEGAVASSEPLGVIAERCTEAFLSSRRGEVFDSEEKERVGQALFALYAIEGEPHAELIAVIDATLARARRDFIPDEEEIEDRVRDMLDQDGLDEYELEEAMSDRDESYLEAREEVIDQLCDLELAPAQELSNFVYDLWHALGSDRGNLRDQLPSPGQARALRQEADRARAELPQAA